jgi:hypothetical protein
MYQQPLFLNQPESGNSIRPRAYSKEDTPIYFPASGFEARYEHVTSVMKI